MPSEQRPSRGIQLSSQAQKGTVLVVTDVKALRRLYRNRLSMHGFGHVLARDGYEALISLNEPAIDIILLDLAMPPMSAETFASHVRNNVRGRKLPIVLISPQPFLIEASKVFDKVLAKPCAAAAMMNAIEDL